jgi:hypothetical protein
MYANDILAKDPKVFQVHELPGFPAGFSLICSNSAKLSRQTVTAVAAKST